MPESTSQVDAPASPASVGAASGAAADLPGSRQLPHYTRSLLRIPVPVVVTLAQKRQPLGRVIELSPGAILQFDKSCEEMLELFIGDRRIACGEAVKVGDKFGLRVTSITPPDERYYPLGRL
jgi:flagellar motor switch/type III secretory pathway protein FliN